MYFKYNFVPLQLIHPTNVIMYNNFGPSNKLTKCTVLQNPTTYFSIVPKFMINKQIPVAKGKYNCDYKYIYKYLSNYLLNNIYINAAPSSQSCLDPMAKS